MDDEIELVPDWILQILDEMFEPFSKEYYSPHVSCYLVGEDEESETIEYIYILN